MKNKRLIIISIFCLSITQFSCFEKKVNSYKVEFYSDFNEFNLEGINPQPITSNDSTLIKVTIESPSKKTVSIPCCSGGRYDLTYNYDGRAWVNIYNTQIEGCHQYWYTYIFDNKKIVLRYCGDPMTSSHYFLKAYLVASKELTVLYGFNNVVVVNKPAWAIIDDKSIIKKANYKDVIMYNLKEGNILERYSYNYYGVEIDIGLKQNEEREYYDLGDKSIYSFHNCLYCFKPMNK